MASANIALVCGLNFQVGCQDRLAEVSEVLAHNHFSFVFLYDILLM